MVAMAIMVHSFRDSFELWLVKLLPADLQLRAGRRQRHRARCQRRCSSAHCRAAGRGARRVSPRAADLSAAGRSCARHADRARHAPGSAGRRCCRWLREARLSRVPSRCAPAWVSEALQDLYGLASASVLELPLDGRAPLLHRRRLARLRAPRRRHRDRREDYIARNRRSQRHRGSIWQRPQQQRGGDCGGDSRGAGRWARRSRSSRARAARALADSCSIAPLRHLRTRGRRSADRPASASASRPARPRWRVARSSACCVISACCARQVLAMLASEGVVLSTLAVLYGLAARRRC